MRVLAGDIGGTYTRLGLVEVGDTARVLAEHTSLSKDVVSLAPLVQRFLTRLGELPDRACFGIAGPVVRGTVTGTNLPWSVNARELGAELGIAHFRLINDFEAVGHGVTRLAPADLLTLQTGEREAWGTIALIGAGTGLGEGFVVRGGKGYQVHPSEGGHATFAAESARDWALYHHLAQRYGHVSWERVVSGPGLIDIFEFLVAGRETGQQAVLRDEMTREDPAAVITRHGLKGDDPLAAEALGLFIEAYGAQTGNLALTMLATGGVYLAGGIARRIAPKLQEGPFIQAFLNKGRMRGLLERMPVKVVLNADVGLLGAAVVAGR